MKQLIVTFSISLVCNLSVHDVFALSPAPTLPACDFACNGVNTSTGTVTVECTTDQGSEITQTVCGSDLESCDTICNSFNPANMFEQRACFDGISESSLLCGMPPLPAEETIGIAGTDVDNDGHRDDIEHMLFDRFYTDPPRMHAIARVAQALQRIIDHPTNQQIVWDSYDIIAQETDCVRNMQPMEVPAGERLLLNASAEKIAMVFILDNRDRQEAYIQAKTALRGILRSERTANWVCQRQEN